MPYVFWEVVLHMCQFRRMPPPDQPLVQKPVKQLNKTVELLGLLGSGNKPSAVARAIGCSKSNITYWIKKFKRMGAIRLQCHDVYDTYALTPYGSTILTGSEKGAQNEVVVLEDHAQKFLIVESEKGLVDWVKLGEPRNWVKLGLKVDGVRVVKNSDRSIVIHPGKLKGFDPDTLLVESGAVVEHVRTILENRFGMVLSSEAAPLHKPVFRFYSEEAKELVRVGTTAVQGIGSIDRSPPERIPHEEFEGRVLAKERLLLPLRVKQLDQKVDSLAMEIHELVSVLKDLRTEAAAQKKPDVSRIVI